MTCVTFSRSKWRRIPLWKAIFGSKAKLRGLYEEVKRSSRSVSKEDRPSLPKQDATEEKEAEDKLHQVADRRTRETFSQTEVLGVG
ncbi:hypothetical protein WN48_04152 [Eufriesea mexicana]|uniref:Uncharacterized protein n=1 Tax=Eufriesea mexicana TaxID=516756 RepID=A0A310SLM9_9HYME|nr:hypothetical protein WN48_04152 [Eufriesea mexicana]